MINTGCGRGFTGGLKYLLRNASRNRLDGKRTALIGENPSSAVLLSLKRQAFIE
jgi:hypothetical protein